MIQLIADMQRREAFSATPYVDSEGFWTIGYGQHDGVTQDTPPVTPEDAEINLSLRLHQAQRDAAAVVGSTWNALNTVRQDALTDLAYNMGKAGLASFSPMLGYLRRGEFDSAAYHLLVNTSGQLQKYLMQTKKRAVEIALRIATGTIIEEQRVQ